MRLIDADVLLEPIADCEERETCIGCPCQILDCEDFERVLKAAPTVYPSRTTEQEESEHTCEFCFYQCFDGNAYPCSMCICGEERKDMWQPKNRRTDQ